LADAPASPPDSTKELDLAKSRSTFGKRDREMAKAAKASAKRARREERSLEEAEPTPTLDSDGSTADQLVIQLRELHEAFEDKRMSFEDFDAARTDLVDRIAVLMASQ
jgi:predicted nucleic acid-binding protein